MRRRRVGAATRRRCAWSAEHGAGCRPRRTGAAARRRRIPRPRRPAARWPPRSSRSRRAWPGSAPSEAARTGPCRSRVPRRAPRQGHPRPRRRRALPRRARPCDPDARHRGPRVPVGCREPAVYGRARRPATRRSGAHAADASAFAVACASPPRRPRSRRGTPRTCLPTRRLDDSAGRKCAHQYGFRSRWQKPRAAFSSAAAVCSAVRSALTPSPANSMSARAVSSSGGTVSPSAAGRVRCVTPHSKARSSSQSRSRRVDRQS